MRNWKSAIGLVFALLPVLYCGGLLLYFEKVRRAGGGLFDRELGPTVIGLGGFGLLFLLLLLWKIRRFVAPPPPPTGIAPDPRPSDFDPDAALARYLSRRGEGGSGPSPGFGRKQG